MIVNASGCLDALAAPDVARTFDAYVSKTVTPRPRAGNDPVRIAETPVGMLNSIGLANPGIDGFRETLPRLADLGVPLWVSVGGFTAADYADTCAQLEEESAVDTIELNVSCPNVEEASDTVAAIVSAARRTTSKTLYTKLSPAVPDIAALALAAAEAGTDGLSLVNTIRGLALDERTLRPILSTSSGGLSGPALLPIALAAVFACYRATGLPLVGMGGVETGHDALELIAVGASAVALGTVLFSDPHAAPRIRAELDAEAAAHGYENALAVRGLAHAAERPLVVS